MIGYHISLTVNRTGLLAKNLPPHAQNFNNIYKRITVSRLAIVLFLNLGYKSLIAASSKLAFIDQLVPSILLRALHSNTVEDNIIYTVIKT